MLLVELAHKKSIKDIIPYTLTAPSFPDRFPFVAGPFNPYKEIIDSEWQWLVDLSKMKRYNSIIPDLAYIFPDRRKQIPAEKYWNYLRKKLKAKQHVFMQNPNEGVNLYELMEMHRIFPERRDQLPLNDLMYQWSIYSCVDELNDYNGETSFARHSLRRLLILFPERKVEIQTVLKIGKDRIISSLDDRINDAQQNHPHPCGEAYFYLLTEIADLFTDIYRSQIDIGDSFWESLRRGLNAYRSDKWRYLFPKQAANMVYLSRVHTNPTLKG